MVRRLGMAYFGGAIGAAISSLALWVAGRADLTALLGVAMAPSLTWVWLGPRVLEGSLWGLLFPWMLRRGLPPVHAGLVLSLAPSAAHLFYLLPESGHGMLGVRLGALTPVVILAVNAIWGWTLARVVVAGGEAGSK